MGRLVTQTTTGYVTLRQAGDANPGLAVSYVFDAADVGTDGPAEIDIRFTGCGRGGELSAGACDRFDRIEKLAAITAASGQVSVT